MLKFEPYIPLVILVAAIIGVTYEYRLRAKVMRELSAKWNLGYSAGETRFFGVWRLKRLARPPVRFPAGFKMRCDPIYLMSAVWNVIDGEIRGIRVVIFDSRIGRGRGARPCTLIAIESSENLFKNVRSREKIAERAGWIAIYRISFWGLKPWTLSVARIEEILSGL